MGIKNRAPNADERAKLEAVPPITDDMLDVLRCWHDLESCRPVSLGPSGAHIGQVPWTAIDTWARRHDLDDRAFRLLVDTIGYLDAKYLERQASQQRMKK